MTHTNRTIRGSGLVLVLILAFAVRMPASAGEHWPLRNGDFSQAGRSWLPAHWQRQVSTGEHAFSMVSSWTRDDPITRGIINTTKAGHACFQQDIRLLRGRYRFSVDVRCGDGGLARVVAGGTAKDARKQGEWEMTSLAADADDSLLVRLFSVGGGVVEFTNARIDPIRIESAPVPLADATQLGGIVLPGEPLPSEEFAAWELQKYIYQMTARVPGLRGRDETHPGRLVHIGGAVVPELTDRPRDSYVVRVTDDRIVLCGNTPSGTLYAVYEFLKLQGCSWRLPGAVGEEIPKRESLILPASPIIESPHYDVRGLQIDGQSFFPAGGWIPADMEAYLDWAVRNRMNAIWIGSAETIKFGAHRGYGHQQTLNHSWRNFLLDGHPEWFVLHNGRRTKFHTTGRPNQLCVSNQRLRDHVVETALRHFKENPHDAAFALNAEDEPCFWCECEPCRVLDPDNGKEAWKALDDGWPELSMTDRALNFVNEVAARVAEVYPDKLIEMYGYGATRKPPVREQVHPNVEIKYTYWPGNNPFGHSLLDGATEAGRLVVETLDGWQKAGAEHFGLYDYGNYQHPDVPWFWFQHAADTLRTFHDRWGFRHALGETCHSFPQSAVIYNLRAELMWDTHADWESVITQVCHDLYGPAAETMLAYNMFMHEILLESDLWQREGWTTHDILPMREYGMDDMAKGKAMLDEARAEARDNKDLQTRIAYVRFGHAFMTFTRVQQQDHPDATSQQAGRAAHELANDLARKHAILVDQHSVVKLKVFYFPPIVERVVHDLALTWRFRLDPGDRGLEEAWFRVPPDDTWVDIRTDSAWTNQGHNYHGVAWYQIEFTVPEDRRPAFAEAAQGPVLHFGAVDGNAEIFLDGTKIGEQKMDVNFMWDQPFAIPLPEGFDAAVSHRLAVRVNKDSAAAGIWKPVAWVMLEKSQDEAAVR